MRIHEEVMPPNLPLFFTPLSFSAANMLDAMRFFTWPLGVCGISDPKMSLDPPPGALSTLQIEENGERVSLITSSYFYAS